MSDEAILIIPEWWRNGLPPRKLEHALAYVNERDPKAVEHDSLLRGVITNNLSKAVSGAFSATLFEVEKYEQPQLVYGLLAVFRDLAPRRCWGSTLAMNRWLSGAYADLPRDQLFDPINCDHLDELIGNDYPVDALLGRRVDHHLNGVSTLIRWKCGLRIPIRVTCYYCHRHPITLYTMSGLHRGAWCYATDEEGTFVNLRDQVYACKRCNEKRKRQ